MHNLRKRTQINIIVIEILVVISNKQTYKGFPFLGDKNFANSLLIFLFSSFFLCPCSDILTNNLIILYIILVVKS